MSVDIKNEGEDAFKPLLYSGVLNHKDHPDLLREGWEGQESCWHEGGPSRAFGPFWHWGGQSLCHHDIKQELGVPPYWEWQGEAQVLLQSYTAAASGRAPDDNMWECRCFGWRAQTGDGTVHWGAQNSRWVYQECTGNWRDGTEMVFGIWYAKEGPTRSTKPWEASEPHSNLSEKDWWNWGGYQKCAGGHLLEVSFNCWSPSNM